MQQKLPCDICGQRPLSPAIVGYHRWYNGELRYGYKQRMCFKCAQATFGTLMKVALDETTDGQDWSENCVQCGEGLGEDAALTYSTWYRGDTRRDTVLPLCVHCAANARSVMMEHATSLEDRQQKVQEGGAPHLNPERSISRDDLPW